MSTPQNLAHTILIENGTVIPLGMNALNEGVKVLEKHALIIKQGRIERILPQTAVTKEMRAQVSRVLDAKGKLVMPGWINAHMHFYSTLVRGLGKAKPSANFVEVLNNLWWRLDRKLSLEDSELSAEVMLIDAIRKGTTTLIDHHASPFAVRGSLNAIASAVERTGLRASLCYEVSDRDGAKIAQEGLDENAEFIRNCRALPAQRREALHGLFGLHASFTVGDGTLDTAVRLAQELGTGLHVHTAEAQSDQDACLKEHGMRVVERFAKHGVLGPQTICAHAVHVNEAEMALLAQSKTMVVHNPQSNLNNAVGIADVLALLSKGVLVGLGTDAMTVDMPCEMRVALWAQKFRHNNPGAAFVEMLSLLPFNNAKIADRLWPGLGLGTLQEGRAADVILIDYVPPTRLDSGTFLGHLGFGIAEAAVNTTICQGQVLMHDKKLEIAVDEERVCARSRECAEKLWERF